MATEDCHSGSFHLARNRNAASVPARLTTASLKPVVSAHEDGERLAVRLGSFSRLPRSPGLCPSKNTHETGP
jgi:hypothetical protein